MDKNIYPAETGIHLLASNKINAGVTNGANKVVQEVMATDKATFPLDKNVMTFDDVPPGQQPTRMTPAATSGGNLNPTASPNAISGIIINCLRTPIATFFGWLKNSLKSSNDMIIPIPNIITPSSTDKIR